VHLLAGLVAALACGLGPWAMAGVRSRWLEAGAGASLVAMVVGAVFGLPLYPLSDVVILVFGVCGGTLLGRVMPPKFVPFLVLLMALSVLDVAQNVAFSGPASASPAPGGGLDPHFIWLNFRVPLPTGHFSLGFADLVVIAAASEHFRRRSAGWPVALLPGMLGLAIGDLLAVGFGNPSQPAVAALLQSLIPLVTLGWLVAVAVERIRSGAESRGAGFS
jgi:hypothetical protein